MSIERPPFLYKYRGVTNESDLHKDYALDALINSYAIFSSRKNFNDLFDSKIELVKPSARQIKSARNKSDKETYKFLDKWISHGRITPEGYLQIQKLEIEFNALIDSYVFLSVSAKSTSNLMWSHYANSHRGFCIEFRTEHVTAEKVDYQDNIPQIKIAEILALPQNPEGDNHIGAKIWRALRIKLREWDYEEEYRFQLSNSGTGRMLNHGEKFLKIPYTADFVESVIFGCRTPPEIKKFIASNMPFSVKLKEAIERTSSIEIIDSPLVVSNKGSTNGKSA
jgi:hypothetical protein